MNYNYQLVLYLESFKIIILKAAKPNKTHCELCYLYDYTSPVHFESLLFGFTLCHILCATCVDRLRILHSKHPNQP